MQKMFDEAKGNDHQNIEAEHNTQKKKEKNKKKSKKRRRST